MDAAALPEGAEIIEGICICAVLGMNEFVSNERCRLVTPSAFVVSHPFDRKKSKG
jgi:hypothetical protein